MRAMVMVLSLFLLLGWARPAAGLELTAATVFLCDEKGAVDPAGRWNSGPIDAAWDLFFYDGEVFDPRAGSPGEIRWLHGEDHRIRIPIGEGTRTFTFHFDSSSLPPIVGLNLFFDGRHDRPGISAFTRLDEDGPPRPEFSANGAGRTMGWPITDVPGAGALTHATAEAGLWVVDGSGGALRATLQGFWVAAPGAAGDLDLVGPHGVGKSGRPDCIGQLTLAIEKHFPAPPEPILWLETAAGISLGGPGREAGWSERFGDRAVPPFSFTCGGKDARELLKGWKMAAEHRKLDDGRIAHRISYSDPITGLEVRWEGMEYHEFTTVEWILHFRNAGLSDSPILSDLLSLDVNFQRRVGEEFLLHHWRGTSVRRDDYEPLETALPPSTSLRFAPPGGRPCGRVFPYFNLEAGGEGVLIAIGWPGQWAAEFTRDQDRGLRVRAGQELTRLSLHPGEEIRTPLTVLQFWEGGDWIDAQNAWRRWMLRHNLPRPGGRLPRPPQLAACSSHQFGEMIHADDLSQKLFIDRYLEEGLELDYWWMDAGWYINDWGWPHTGTWEVDRKRFPGGLRPITDHGRARGVKSIVWFEPERVAAKTWLSMNHPEWIIGGAGGGLLDIGIPEARQWLTEHVDRIITAEGIDLYRQDYNIDPLDYWRRQDPPERQGITESRYVRGYLAYWDELRRRHPEMLIDTCASGGHRNDLETLRRAVPLLRSDYIFEPVGQQGHTYGLAFWIPFFGTAVSYPDRYDPYTYRSNMCPHNTACFDVRRRDFDYELIRRLHGEWRRIAPYYYGDYYPLTPYSVAEDDWIAWQFHDREAGGGAIQAFRREKSSFFGIQFRLRGLEAGARYELIDLDRPGPFGATGRQLLEEGLKVIIEERPGAAVLIYRKID